LATRLLGHGLIFPPGVPLPDSVKVFKTVPESMFTLFRVMSGAQSDEESTAIDSLMTTLPTIKFAFIFFMVTSSWTLLSILTAVVSDNMIATTHLEADEAKIASDEEDRETHKKELQELFEMIDRSGDGFVEEDDIIEFLKDPEQALRTAKSCGVAARNVVAVLKTLAPDGKPVKMNEFVECIMDAGQPVTEQSIMKIEWLFRKSQKQIDKGFNLLSNTASDYGNQIRAVASKRLQCYKILQSVQPDHSDLDPAAPVMDMSTTAAISGLAGKQKKNSEGICKLRESVQALLRSQEALRHQNMFNNARKATLEAGLAALEERNSSAFASLHETVEALKEDLNMMSMLPPSQPAEAGKFASK